jgi:hypothetical protein
MILSMCLRGRKGQKRRIRTCLRCGKKRDRRRRRGERVKMQSEMISVGYGTCLGRKSDGEADDTTSVCTMEEASLHGIVWRLCIS